MTVIFWTDDNTLSRNLFAAWPAFLLFVVPCLVVGNDRAAGGPRWAATWQLVEGTRLYENDFNSRVGSCGFCSCAYASEQRCQSETQVARETASMRKEAKGTFAIKSWDEKTLDEIEGAQKLTRVSAIKAYQGDIEGEGKLEYLMMYRTAGSASFIGLERVTGSVGGRSGSFVLQHNGTFEDGVAKVKLSVVPGSGTGICAG